MRPVSYGNKKPPQDFLEAVIIINAVPLNFDESCDSSFVPCTIIHVAMITGANPAGAYYRFGPSSKAHSAVVPMPPSHQSAALCNSCQKPTLLSHRFEALFICCKLQYTHPAELSTVFLKEKFFLEQRHPLLLISQKEKPVPRLDVEYPARSCGDHDLSFLPHRHDAKRIFSLRRNPEPAFLLFIFHQIIQRHTEYFRQQAAFPDVGQGFSGFT